MGIPTMRRAMERNGSPLPQLETDEQYTYFLTTLPVHPVFEGDQVNSLEKEAIDDRVLEVVRLAVTPKSGAQLLEELGLSVHTKLLDISETGLIFPAFARPLAP